MYKDPDARDKQPSGVVLVLAVVGALALIAALAFLALVIFAVKLFPSSASLSSGEHRYLGHHSFSSALAGIKLEGPIGPDAAEEVVEKLNEAAHDKGIKGIFLEVNSPGGSVVASQEIHDTIRRIKEKIPVVVYMREVAASGAYYSSVSANWLVANRGTMVGSIGVIFNSFEATQLVDWLKLKPVTLKTGRLKDAGSNVRPWTPEDKIYLQKLIDDTRDQFVADVRASRPKISNETIQHMSDGRVVLGSEAAKRNLVDSLGSRSDAIAKAAEIAGLSTGAETKVIPMENPEIPGFLSEILRSSISNTVSLVLRSIGMRQSSGLPAVSSPLLDVNSSETHSRP
ncbi:signal peptide peptidase SppA [bacterium]|nr:signal peptide peptidase SppA [bacterium]